MNSSISKGKNNAASLELLTFQKVQLHLNSIHSMRAKTARLHGDDPAS